MVPHWKPSSWPWPSSFWVALLSCYSPEIGEELSVLGTGGALGTDVSDGPPGIAPLLPAGGAGTPSSAGSGGTQPGPGALPPLMAAPAALGCTPRLAVAQVLPAACAGEPYFYRLQLECGAGEQALPAAVTWLPTSLPQELTLTPQGELLGSAALSAGTHELRARALLAGSELQVGLQLEVLERCFLFAAAQALASDGAQSPSRILAQRLDTARALWLPEALPADSEVLRFDASADGRWLAAVSSSPAGERLMLFHVTGGSVSQLGLEHAGAHVAHAFSPSSGRLAVVTDLATDASAPPDRRLSLMDLGALAAEEALQVALQEQLEVPYQTGLGWADASTLQFIGVSAQFPTFFAPNTLRLPEAGLATAELTELLYPMDPADLIRWFRPLPDGFYLMTNALSYVNASATLAALHLRAQALSPIYQFSAHALEGRLLLHTADTSDEQPAAYATGGCERLLAWSGDGQTLLCVFEGQLVQHQLGESGLTATRLDTAWPAAGTQRSVVSHGGRWSLVADDEHGLFLLARSEPPPQEPLLAATPAEAGWDFAISRDERHLWVQQGRRLSLATLGADEGAKLTLLSEAMAAPAACTESGLPLPEAWCGSSELDGAVRLRREGRYLAFADASGALTLVDMAAPARQQQPGARLARTCTEHCIQFQ